MNVHVTYYLEVISSWCYWAEPAWAELKQRYAGKSVTFDWKLALMDSNGLPASKNRSRPQRQNPLPERESPLLAVQVYR